MLVPQGRVGILHVHARGKKVEDGLDWHKVARATAGFTGAELMNLMNTAAVVAVRRGSKIITEPDVFQARLIKLRPSWNSWLAMVILDASWAACLPNPAFGSWHARLLCGSMQAPGVSGSEGSAHARGFARCVLDKRALLLRR